MYDGVAWRRCFLHPRIIPALCCCYRHSSYIFCNKTCFFSLSKCYFRFSFRFLFIISSRPVSLLFCRAYKQIDVLENRWDFQHVAFHISKWRINQDSEPMSWIAHSYNLYFLADENIFTWGQSTIFAPRKLAMSLFHIVQNLCTETCLLEYDVRLLFVSFFVTPCINSPRTYSKIWNS